MNRKKNNFVFNSNNVSTHVNQRILNQNRLHPFMTCKYFRAVLQKNLVTHPEDAHLKSWHIRAIFCDRNSRKTIWLAYVNHALGPLSSSHALIPIHSKKHHQVKKNDGRVLQRRSRWFGNRTEGLIYYKALLRCFDVSKYLNEECNVTCSGQRFIAKIICARRE